MQVVSAIVDALFSTLTSNRAIFTSKMISTGPFVTTYHKASEPEDKNAYEIRLDSQSSKFSCFIHYNNDDDWPYPHTEVCTVLIFYLLLTSTEYLLLSFLFSIWLGENRGILTVLRHLFAVVWLTSFTPSPLPLMIAALVWLFFSGLLLFWQLHGIRRFIGLHCIVNGVRLRR